MLSRLGYLRLYVKFAKLPCVVLEVPSVRADNLSDLFKSSVELRYNHYDFGAILRYTVVAALHNTVYRTAFARPVSRPCSLFFTCKALPVFFGPPTSIRQLRGEGVQTPQLQAPTAGGGAPDPPAPDANSWGRGGPMDLDVLPPHQAKCTSSDGMS